MIRIESSTTGTRGDLLALAIFAILVAFAAPALAQESYEASSTWELRRVVSQTTTNLDDLPGHRLGLITTAFQRTQGGALAGRQMTISRCSEIADTLQGSGFPHFYCTISFDNGDRLFVRYRGEYRGADLPWGGVTVTGSGSWQCIGGTGAFRAYAGEGTWQASGELSQDGARRSWSLVEQGTYRPPVRK